MKPDLDGVQNPALQYQRELVDVGGIHQAAGHRLQAGPLELVLIPPRGDPVDVYLVFKNSNGKMVEHPIGDFVTEHPSMKILALSFLLLVGVMLVVESLEGHVPKGYIYFAMTFSLGIELLNMRMRKNRHVVELNTPEIPDGSEPVKEG